MTDRGDRCGVLGRYGEVGSDCLRPRDEEAYRRRGQGVVDGQRLPRLRQSQGQDRTYLLLGQAQPRPAGDQDGQARTPAEEVRDQRRRLDDLLEVVEHKQQPLVAYQGRDPVEE